MKASDLFVKCLEAEGVDTIFGIPGEENLDFLESLSKSKIQLVLTRHEQAAGFMAATYGRLTAKVGVCLSTLGPGATNLVTAAAYANLGAMPILMITGQKPIKSSKQGKFQILDIIEMMRPVTKYTKQIESSQKIPAYVREAFRIANQERLGATHLELPEDICTETINAEPLRESASQPQVANVASINQVVDVIQQAESPLILLGAGANRHSACKAIREFINHCGIGFITTQMGKGVADESHPQFIGNAALSSDDFVHRAFDFADVIINIGHDVIEKPPFFMSHNNQTVIHINTTSAQIDPVYFPQIECIGDIGATMTELKARLPASQRNLPECFANVQKSIAEHFNNYSNDEHFPIRLPFLVKELRDILPADGFVALDNGIYKLWFARNFPAYQPNTVLLDNALASMGAGLPSAIMAAHLNPQKNVIAVCGDGGFMMNSAELETAVRLKLNLVVVILDDKALGMIKWKQKNMGFDDYGLDLSNPDFVAYAQSYGVKAVKIEDAASFKKAVAHSLKEGGVHLIHTPVDYSQNDFILNEELKELSQAM